MTEAVIIKKPVQWTGFYMITASVMKELRSYISLVVEIILVIVGTFIYLLRIWNIKRNNFLNVSDYFVLLAMILLLAIKV